MKTLIPIILFLSAAIYHSEAKGQGFKLKAYVQKVGIDSLTKEEFLRQNLLQLNSSALNIKSYVAYIFPCPGCLVNDAQIISVKGNTLKDKKLL